MEVVSCQYCFYSHRVTSDCLGFWCSCGARIERDMSPPLIVTPLQSMPTSYSQIPLPGLAQVRPPPIPSRPTRFDQPSTVTIVSLAETQQQGNLIPSAPAHSPIVYNEEASSTLVATGAPLTSRSTSVSPVTVTATVRSTSVSPVTVTSPAKKRSNTNTNESKKSDKIAEAKINSDGSPKTCQSCNKGFSLLGGRWKHSCRSCGLSVCGNCSRGKWPSQMLPSAQNPKNEKALRVCTACQTRMESFRKALLAGNVEDAKEIYESGIIQLYYPYQIYPHRLYPVHCAALSGSIDCFSWLVSKGCHPSVQDARGCTPLALAAKKGHQSLVKYMIFRGVSEVREIRNVEVLQKCLQSTMIELQQKEIEISMKRMGETTINANKVDNRSCYPLSPFEEEAQLKLAMDLSMANSGQKAAEDALYSYSYAYESDNEEGKCQDEDCVVCFERKIDCVIIPCGHMSCCQECTTQFKECPVCRTEIKQVVKTYKT